jgi:hypothetical protein
MQVNKSTVKNKQNTAHKLAFGRSLPNALPPTPQQPKEPLVAQKLNF